VCWPVYNAAMELFACPLCFEPLNRVGGSLKCTHNHSYDLAREGYVNLLTAQHRRSKAPGDNAEMIAARSRFLDAGYYQPLADGLCAAVTARRPGVLADLGCGEAYFTRLLGDRLDTVYGLDISRPAIKAATRRSKLMHLAVASTAQLPLVDSGFDAVTVVMAPLNADVSRVLKPGGRLYRVSAGPDHLVQLKAQIYAQARAHGRARTELDQFTLVNSQRLTFEFTVSGSDLGDLIAMTPMRYTSARQVQAQASQIGQMSLTADFYLDVFASVVTP
jgi:23S rRNA (guanine745-N1)-methyltransferase